MVNLPTKETMINDIVITAIESGYSWFLYEAPGNGSPYFYPFPFVVNEVDWGMNRLDVEPDFPEYPDAILIERYVMTEDKIWEAFTRLAYERKQIPEGLFEDVDADVADVVMQIACFGEVRYG